MTDQPHSRSASIVAVVASVDEYFAQYPAILSLRKSKVEVSPPLPLTVGHHLTIT